MKKTSTFNNKFGKWKTKPYGKGEHEEVTMAKVYAVFKAMRRRVADLRGLRTQSDKTKKIEDQKG
jgi:hypothetical protein